MEQLKFTGIVLKSVDYKEKDKLLTIFSLELGKITATLKGVKQDKAKLKFAAMPFCFAEFVATNKNGFLTITECYQIESFYGVVSNYNKSLTGFLMLEISCIIMQNTPDERWFLTLISFLKELEYGNADSNILSLKFMLETLNKVGYGLSFDNCSECGMPFLNEAYLNLNNGELECSTCSCANSLKLTKQQFAILKLLNSYNVSQLASVKQREDVLLEIKNLLKQNLNYRLGKNINSLV